MKQKSRFARGRENMKSAKFASGSSDQNISMQNFPWRNPFKGDEKKDASAEVTVKGAGLFVGIRMRF